MKKFIHLRGSMATGKTSAARQFVLLGNFQNLQIKVKGKYYPYLYDSGKKTVVTGRYDHRECGGMDSVIEDRELMIDYLVKIIKSIEPDYIVFEAVMYGITMKFAQDLALTINKFGYEYVGLCLLPPLDVAMERVFKRNGGKQIKIDKFVSQYSKGERCYYELKKQGYNVKAIDTSKYAEQDMWKIVQREIDEVSIEAN